jgi:membrane-associated phospholipid phosphatase
MIKQIVLVAISLLALVLAAALTLIFGVALWGTGPVHTLQGVGGGVKALMEFFTLLGSEEFFLLFVPLVYWCINKSLGADMGVLLVFSGFVNGALKSFFKHPRPFWSNPALQLSDASSFSLPSGHAQNSTVVFGYLAFWLAGKENKAGRKSGARWLWVAFLILLILLISISRAYLGVHYPGDILWGCAVGLIIITLYAWLKPRALPWLRQRTIGTHVVLAVIASAVVLGLEALLLSIPFGSGQTYGSLYADARSTSLEEAANLAGMVLGLWIGLALEMRLVRFAVAGTFWRRALRYVIGIAGLFVIWMGLRLIFPEQPPALGLVLRVVRYGLAMLWAIVGWPWLFVRLKLGMREEGAEVRL